MKLPPIVNFSGQFLHQLRLRLRQILFFERIFFDAEQKILRLQTFLILLGDQFPFTANDRVTPIAALAHRKEQIFSWFLRRRPRA